MEGRSEWVARIKWADNNKPETVPITDIRNFHPKDLNDFKRTHWYRVKGPAKYFEDNQKHSAYALIGCLAESESAMSDILGSGKRLTFANIQSPGEDPYSTCSETESRAFKASNSSRNLDVATQQQKAAARKDSKTQRNEKLFNKFVKEHPLDGAKRRRDSGDKENNSEIGNDTQDTIYTSPSTHTSKKKKKSSSRPERQDATPDGLSVMDLHESEVPWAGAVEDKPVPEAVAKYLDEKFSNLQTAFLKTFAEGMKQMRQDIVQDLTNRMETKISEGIQTLTDKTMTNLASKCDFKSLLFVQDWVNKLPDMLESPLDLDLIHTNETHPS